MHATLYGEVGMMSEDFEDDLPVAPAGTQVIKAVDAPDFMIHEGKLHLVGFKAPDGVRYIGDAEQGFEKQTLDGNGFVVIKPLPQPEADETEEFESELGED